MRSSTDYLVVHCSATPPSQDIGATEIDIMHKDRGWKGIGYHYVIRRDGSIENGRNEDEIGAHVKGYNSFSIGICMIGGVDENNNAVNNFTDKQFDTLSELLKILHNKYPNATIQGHRDFPGVNKDCPCFDVSTWLQDIEFYD